ncbi:hypothetical protein Clacol_007840 [Clathrus columnatus]|uniref:Glycosyltransferase family 92 protein n=1 Tax=Clathrus columnatus TaxID=1419009 RepID=A0AAV5ALK4_9AGAM|nr:hypothetical protein Clacol_007840 [Clathrus columnatus]
MFNLQPGIRVAYLSVRAIRVYGTLVTLYISQKEIPFARVMRDDGVMEDVPDNGQLETYEQMDAATQREALNEKVLQIVSDLPPPAFHPWCPTAMETKLRYTDFYAYNSGNPSTIYLAVRIQKPEIYLSSFIHELSTLILYVGSHRFYVHVVFAENTSHDLAKSFGRMMDILRIAYKITFEQSQFIPQGYARQRMNQKNLAMDPFYSSIAMEQLGISSFDYVVLIEDSVFCAGDVLELLFEHKFQGAELTCALEWRGGLLHDKWTIRTSNGKPPYMRSELEGFFNQTKKTGAASLPTPFFTDPATRKRYRFLRSFPLFSCWSSIVILDPRVFLPVSAAIDGNVDAAKEGEEKKPVREKEGLRFRVAANGHDSDQYSDTFLFCVDMWERGMYKILMVPSASVGDTFEMYDLVRQDGRRQLKHPAGLEREGRGLVSYFRWPKTTPNEMVYHDYGIWQQHERVGKWDDSLLPPTKD